MRKSGIAVVVLFVLGIVGLSSVFIVDEREKALVLQFGQIRQVKEQPGLGFKVPFIQEVVRYDGRILSLDTETIEVTPSDDRRLWSTPSRATGSRTWSASGRPSAWAGPARPRIGFRPS
jgi:modulator of FtsH protease HflC